MENKYDIETLNEFKQHLKEQPSIVEHLIKRGISIENINAFHFGFCPPDRYHWFHLLKGRWIIPIHDVRGKLIAYAGRQWVDCIQDVEESLRYLFSNKPSEGQKKINKWHHGKWLNEPYQKSRHLFNLDLAKEHIRELNYAVIVEGYMDALVLYAHGIKNVVALCGVAMTEWHINLLMRYCDHVILILDADEAGFKGVESATFKLKEADIHPHIVHLPTKCDPDEFCLKVGGDNLKNALQNIYNNNTDITNFKLK